MNINGKSFDQFDSRAGGENFHFLPIPRILWSSPVTPWATVISPAPSGWCLPASIRERQSSHLLYRHTRR